MTQKMTIYFLRMKSTCLLTTTIRAKPGKQQSNNNKRRQHHASIFFCDWRQAHDRHMASSQQSTPFMHFENHGIKKKNTFQQSAAEPAWRLGKKRFQIRYVWRMRIWRSMALTNETGQDTNSRKVVVVIVKIDILFSSTSLSIKDTTSLSACTRRSSQQFFVETIDLRTIGSKKKRTMEE